jgi:hypothetical protein
MTEDASSYEPENLGSNPAGPFRIAPAIEPKAWGQCTALMYLPCVANAFSISISAMAGPLDA